MSASVTVGLNGTRESRAAARWAAHEARTRNVPLRLVQVREPETLPALAVHVSDELSVEQSRKTVDEVAEELFRLVPDLATSITTRSGRPSAVLTDLSAETDLLVLGSRGLPGLTGFLLGSTALATVAHAVCPVVLVRGTDDEPARDLFSGVADRSSSMTRKPVVLGLDLGRPCDDLTAFAFQTAVQHSVPLDVLHAWQPHPAVGAGPSYPVGREITADLREERDRALTEALHPWHEKYPEVPLTHRAVQRRASGLLVEAASDASLVIVGRRVRRSRAGTHLGPVAHAVIHHARAPVAVVAHR